MRNSLACMLRLPLMHAARGHYVLPTGMLIHPRGCPPPAGPGFTMSRSAKFLQPSSANRSSTPGPGMYNYY
jgi:hypothetical protein